MPGNRDCPSRRQVLGSAVSAAAAALSARFAAAAPPKTHPIPIRTFGKTGVKLPILGYGGAGLPKRWGNPLSWDDRIRLVRYAYQRGIRFFDTAGNYMESQAILGQALKDLRRDVFLAGKVETTDPTKVRAAVESALRQLQTDHLDLVQIHGTPGLEQMSIPRAMAVHAELVKLRDEGVVRFIGFSAHSYFHKALALIRTGAFDHCMLSYGFLSRGHNQLHSPKMIRLRDQCLAEAHGRGMAIVAMKVIAAGVLGAWAPHLVPTFERKRVGALAAAAIRYVLQDKRVHLLAIGMRLRREIDANIQTIAGGPTFTEADRALLSEFCPRVLKTEPIRKMKVE